LTSQGSLVRSLARLFLFEKPTHDRGCDYGSGALDRRSLKKA